MTFHPTVSRRRAFRFLAGAVACPTCLALISSTAFAAEHGEAVWSYEGDGPVYWGGTSTSNRVCGAGLQQSPIDLRNAINAKTGGIEVRYNSIPLRIINNGHTIEIKCEPGSKIRHDGKDFKLIQFHFHHPSEHAIKGRAYDMEAHFVHASDDGVLAVLGVFISQGAENNFLVPIWENMPTKAGPEIRQPSTIISPARLLPTDRTYYRYLGSLTTPPCSEKVIWSIYQTPVSASKAQIEKFAAIFPMNARPLQSLNRRFLLKSL